MIRKVHTDAEKRYGARASWWRTRAEVGAMVDSMTKLVDPRVKMLKKGGNKRKRA